MDIIETKLGNFIKKSPRGVAWDFEGVRTERKVKTSVSTPNYEGSGGMLPPENISNLGA